MFHFRRIIQLVSILTLLSLAACGGGGGTTGTGSTLSGTAATGAAFQGTINITDNNGAQVGNIVVDANTGSWSTDVTGMVAPFNVQGQPTNSAQQSLYGYTASVDIIVNVTPLTTLAMFIASGYSDLDVLYNAWGSGGSLDSTALSDAQDVINANFTAIYLANGLTSVGYDLISTSFIADGSGIDAVLDELDFNFDMVGGTFSVRDSNGPFAFDDQINTGGGTPATCNPAGAGIPVQFANLEGDYLLAIYVSNNALFPLNALRTEYLFRICAEGSVSILNSNGNTLLHTQMWDGGIGDFAISVGTGDSVAISDSENSVNTGISFSRTGTTGILDASLSVGPGFLGVGGGIWSSDPTIRGSAPPQELLDLAGTTLMQRLTGAAMELGEIYSLTVDGIDGMTTLGPPGNLSERSQGWNTQLGRVEVFDASDPFYKITLYDGSTPRIDITFDGTSGGITLASGVFGATDGGGAYGTVALTETAPVTAATDIGSTFTPGRPLVTDTVNSLQLQYNLVVVGQLKVDLFITYDRTFDAYGVFLSWITDQNAQQSIACACSGVTIDETARTVSLVDVQLDHFGGGSAVLNATSLQY